jgi:hypothetical protein
MTTWNKYGNSLSINSYYNKINDNFIAFLETLSKNIDNENLWEIDDGEIRPISYTYVSPKEYIGGHIAIIQWLRDQKINIESGYAFTYQNEEDYNDRSVGCINSNEKGITFCQIDGDGKITQQFFEI